MERIEPRGGDEVSGFDNDDEEEGVMVEVDEDVWWIPSLVTEGGKAVSACEENGGEGRRARIWSSRSWRWEM